MGLRLLQHYLYGIWRARHSDVLPVLRGRGRRTKKHGHDARCIVNRPAHGEHVLPEESAREIARARPREMAIRIGQEGRASKIEKQLT